MAVVVSAETEEADRQEHAGRRALRASCRSCAPPSTTTWRPAAELLRERRRAAQALPDFIAIKEVPCRYGSIRPDCVYVNDSARNTRLRHRGRGRAQPATSSPARGYPRRNAPSPSAASRSGSRHEVITLHLSQVMRKYAHECPRHYRSRSASGFRLARRAEARRGGRAEGSHHPQ